MTRVCPMMLLLVIAVLCTTHACLAVPLRGPVSIDLTADGHYAIVVFRKDHSVSIIDLSSDPYTFVTLGQGDGIGTRPVKVRCFESVAIVVNEYDTMLTLIDVPNATVIGQVDVPLYCQDVMWDAARSQYYVSNSWLDRVLVFDAQWQQVAPLEGIEVGRRPGPMALGPQGRLWVGNRGSFDVSVVDPDIAGEIDRVEIGSRPEDVAATGGSVLVTNHGGNELEAVNGVPLIHNDQVDIRNVLTEIDPVTLSTTELYIDRGADYAGLDVGHGLIVFSGAAGGTVHVHRMGDPVKLLLTSDLLAGDALPGGFVGGNPNGNRIFTNTRDVVARLPDQVFAINFLRDTMVELWIVGNELIVHGETPFNAAGEPIQAFQQQPAVVMTAIQNGERYFSTLSAWSRGQEDFSCATCHTDGHSDFRMILDTKSDPHNPDHIQGIERHPSARFSGSTAPFAYEGDKVTLFEMTVAAIDTHDAPPMNGFVALDTAEFMRIWQSRLLAGPNPNPSDNPVGEALFNGKAGCVSCHPGPFFTDDGLHDVGTGRVINTPTLLGVWDQVQLLHDARAVKLEDVLEPATYGAGQEQHGNLETLSEAERTAIAAYVRGLSAPTPCPADLDGNGTVGVEDMVDMILSWGQCPLFEDCPADLDGNSKVGVEDLIALLLAWGECE